jgi:hypothetical protein
MLWQPSLSISTDIGMEYQVFPAVAVSNDKVHAVWTVEWVPLGGDWDIYYAQFNGTSWQPQEELTMDVLDEQQNRPAIATDGDEVHAIWENLNPDWFLQYRYYNGSAWQSIQDFDDSDGEWELYPSIAAENGKIYMVWTDGPVPPMNGNISFRYFDGTAWQPEETISTDIVDESQSNPDIAVENGEAYVVFSDRKDVDSDIYFRHFNGTSWEPEIEISADLGPSDQIRPRIAVDNGRIYVVWEDKRDGDYDIYYRYFDGITWQPIEEISIDLGSELQSYPDIAASDGIVHVVWEDKGDGDDDIYYRQLIPTTFADLKVSINDIVFNPQ